MNPFVKKRPPAIPAHVAIILDGNGRWAKRRGMPRTFGHQAGVENIRRVALLCAGFGVRALSVFAFSTENWKRPEAEVAFLMKLPGEFEKKFADDFKKHDIRVTFSGRRTKLSPENLAILDRITTRTAERKGLVLNICFDYGSQTEIAEAVRAIAEDVRSGDLEPAEIVPETISSRLYTKDLPPLDLLIRTSGEQRLSNFLLWQAAYAELWFTDTYWPDFGEKDLLKAFEAFGKRDRRYGGLTKGEGR
ncbi:MAG: polyprenyl diphosphate synthase [Candidatus Izemoplasmatales bacterium]